MTKKTFFFACAMVILPLIKLICDLELSFIN
ncbi:Uncharacterised protein [Leminorella grimontii]|nr:Uncharacterised protein [Leminorella grimontii]